jgi:all-trans-8'-apo-beta-carotenal 15,15'-oxygenase
MLQEDSYVLTPAQVPGLPRDLVGTLYRNGPAKFKIGSRQMLHPWEGDGAVAALTFLGDGTVWFRNRFVRTEGYQRERRAGYQLYRGTFATPLPGGVLTNAFRLEQKNLANTNVIYHGDQLLALYEGGLPHELLADTLETKGPVRLGGALRERMATFTAHPHVDPLRQNRVVGFCSGFRSRGMYVRFLEFAADGWTRCAERKIDVDGFGFFHDFMLTQRYYILLQAPLRFHPLPFVLGLKCAGECISWEGDRLPTRILLVPRDDPSAPVQEILSETCTAFHFVNAYDDGDAVVLDACRMDRLFLGDRLQDAASKTKTIIESVDFATQVPKCSLWRCRVPVTNNRRNQTASWQELNTTHVDFPMVNPSRLTQTYRYAYMAASALDRNPGPLKNIIKVDAESGATLAVWKPDSIYEFAGEPVFAPRAGEQHDAVAEDDGYILSMVCDGFQQRTYLAILQATDLSLVCKVPLRTFVPMGLHGTWTSKVFKPKMKRRNAQDVFESKNWNEMNSSFPMFRF